MPYEEDLRHPWGIVHCVHCGHPHRFQMRCKDRTCPRCRKLWFGYHYKTLLDLVSTWKAAYFLTLTIKNIPDAAWGRYCVQDLRDNFTRLRRRFHGPFSGVINGGFYVVQATNKGNGWHLHLHVLYDGTFLPHKMLSKAWAEITGGSWIVGIELVQDPKKAVHYLLRDFLQGPQIRPQDADAFNSVFRGSRMVQPFGIYKKTKFRILFKCPVCGCEDWDLLSNILGEPVRWRRHYENDS